MRRIRLLLAALAIGLIGPLLVGSPASAADLDDDEACMVERFREELGLDADVPAGEAVALAEDQLSEEELADVLMGCHEAPNPLVPALYEVFWGAFGLAVVMFGMWKFALPAVRKTLDARADRIRNDLESAESQRVEAERVLAEYNAQLTDARAEAARILEEARQDAESVRSERIAAIDGEIAELRQRAATEVEASKAQALSDLRGEITALALGAAERVVERNLDDETNRALIDAYIDSVGTNGS